jgi:hypothetical protein
MGRSVGRAAWLVVMVGTLGLAACKPPPPPPPPPKSGERPPAALAAEAGREREALAAAVEAYVYGYPLVSSELARRAATNVERPQGWQAPMGQLARPHAADLAGEPGRGTDPDTLGFGAWLDVTSEPWVLSLPDAKGRFLSLVLRSAWQQQLDLSTAHGAKGRAVRIAVTGPGWSGKLPAGVREVRSPTPLVHLEGRVLAAGGPNELREAQAWVDKLSLLPLSANPKKYQPALGRPDASLDTARPVRDQVHALDAVIYFKLLATLLKTNQPAPGEDDLLPVLARIGLVPGKDYDPSGLDASVIKALAGVPKVAQEKILAAAVPAAPVNGWSLPGVGAPLPGPLGRAAVVAAGVDRALEGVVLTAAVDGAGKPLDGATRRALRFTRGKGPPADALWTLAVIEPAGKKASHVQLTSRAKFTYGRDGSLELLLQPDLPKGREANWLQVPAGPYLLVLRLHAPREKAPSVLDGSWKPPPVGKPH